MLSPILALFARISKPLWLNFRSTGAEVAGGQKTFSSNGCSTLNVPLCATSTQGSESRVRGVVPSPKTMTERERFEGSKTKTKTKTLRFKTKTETKKCWKVFLLQMLSKTPVDEVFMHHFQKMSSASGGFAPDPHWGAAPKSCWVTSVL